MKNYEVSISTGIGGEHGVFERSYRLERDIEQNSNKGRFLIISQDKDYLRRNIVDTKRVIIADNIESILRDDKLSNHQKLAKIILTFDKDIYTTTNKERRNSSNIIIQKQLLAIFTNRTCKII